MAPTTLRTWRSTLLPGARWVPAVAPHAGLDVDALDIGICRDLGEAEPAWRLLEGVAPRSVYQRFDWIAPWQEHAGKAQGVTPTIVVGRYRNEPVFLLPLGRRWCSYGRVGNWLGGSHVNINLGLFRPDFRAVLDGAQVRRLFRRIVPQLGGIDFLALGNQPKVWRGLENPLWHLPNRLRAQPVHSLALDGDFEAVLARQHGARKRKKLRWQENALAPAGGYRFLRAGTPEEALKILDVFFHQKAIQFERSGIANVFAAPGVADFFRTIAARSAAAADPMIELYCLEIGGQIRATFAAGADGGRVHGFFSGMALDEYARVSPGELLLFNLVRESCRRGFAEIDLGVGQERYKSSWLPREETQFTTFVPVSGAGRLIVAGLLAGKAAQLAVRKRPRLYAIYRRTRARLAGRPSPAPPPPGDDA